MTERVVWKYQLGVPPNSIPACAKVLHVGLQNNRAYAWCELDPMADQSRQTPVIEIPTGYEFDNDEYDHIGTVVYDTMAIVIHFYRRRI